jgi:iron(III) transport system permease protein
VLLPLLVMYYEAFASLPSVSVLLPDKRQMILLANSLIIGIGTTLGSFAAGFPLAFLISRAALPFKRLFFGFSFIPLFIPPYLNTIGWVKLIGPSGLNLSFNLYGHAGVILIMSLAYFPFITLLALAGLNSVDPRYEEAASLVSSPRKIFRSVTLPLIYPYLISGMIFVFVFSISNYSVPDLLRVNTYPVEIFTQFSAFYDSRQAALLSLPLMVVTLILILFQRHYMGRKAYCALNTQRRANSGSNFGAAKIPALCYCAGIVLFSSVIPVSILIINAGPWSTYLTAWKTAHSQILNTVFLAAASATIMVGIGFPLGYIIQRAGKTASLTVDILSLLPFAVPGAVLGIGLIKLWNRPATNFIYATLLVVFFAHTARFIAFAVRVAAAGIGRVPKNIEEAAALVPKNFLSLLGRIIFPLNKKTILYAWIVCFAFSAGELEATLLVTPAGEATLPIRIYTLLHYGAYKLVFSLCVILIAVIFLPFLAALVIKTKRSPAV